MPFVDTTTGAGLHYDERGTGTPFILLHGLLGTAELHFPRLMDWLAPQYRVLGVSLRGYGASTPKPRDFPPQYYHRDAADVLALMDALNLRKAHLLGYSDGGETALLLAGLAPERFHSVMSIGAVGWFGPELLERQRVYPATWITEEEMRLHQLADVDAFALGWVAAMKGYSDAGGEIGLELADKITCPLLLMLGERDRLNPQEIGQRFIDRVPQGELAMFDAGHPVHDDAWDDFTRVVSAFLAKARPESPSAG
jgi:valacyclovir hydrolase